MNKIVEFIKKSGIYFIGNVLVKISAFFLLPLYTKYISPEEYGYYDLTITYLSMIMPIICIEIWTTIMRFTLEKKKKNDKWSIVTNSLLIFSISICVYFLSLSIINEFVDIRHFNLILIYGIFNMLSNVYTYIVRGFNLNFIFMISGLVSSILNLIINVILIYIFKMDVRALYISMIIAWGIQIVILEVNIKILSNVKIRYIDKKILKDMIIFSIPLSVNSFCYWFLTGYNRIVINNNIGMEANGYFAIAGKFTAVLTLVTTCIGMAWQETTYSECCSKDKNKLYSNGCNYYLLALLSGTIIFLPIIKLIFPFMIDNRYEYALNIIPLYLISTIASIFSGFLGSVFTAEKKTNIIFTSTLIASIINVILVNWLVNIIGINAANISLLMAFTVMIVIRIVLLRRYILINLDIKKIIMLLVILSFACLSFIYGSTFINILTIILGTFIVIYLYKDIIINLIIFARSGRRKE